jgi:hypothetical protein
MYHSPVGQWMAQHAVDERGIGDSLECRAFAVGQRCFWYVPLLADENEKIKDWLIALTKARKNWGGVDCATCICATSSFSNGTTNGFVGLIMN